MQQPKTPKKKQNLYIIQEKKSELKKISNEKNKNYLVKFSRQTSSKISIPTSIKTSLIVPELNLVKINSPKKQKISQNKLQNLHKKQHNRLQTKQTKDPLTSYRHSELQFDKNEKDQFQMSPSISNRYLHSPIQTLLKSSKSKVDSDSVNSQADKQQLLLLQIKQLKRQNTFLKKKIRDLKKQLNGGFLPEEYERKSPSNKQNQTKRQKKGFPKANIESLHLSVNLFFSQIKNLLNSVTQLFRIEFTENQIKQFQLTHSEEQIVQELNEQICPLRKHQILKKFFLKRKLDRLAYEEDQKRYQMLLTIFTEYYTFKEESQKKVVQTIDNMIMYTNDLNRWLIEKAYAKRMKSEVQSQKSTQRQFVDAISPPKFDSLRVPPNMINHVINYRGLTLSPNSKPTQNI